MLLTEATWDSVAGQLEGVAVADLGRHRLKDIPTPERLYQLLAPGLSADFPAVRSLGSAGSLPQPATSLSAGWARPAWP